MNDRNGLVATLQTTNEMWFRSPHLIMMITTGQVVFNAAKIDRNLRIMHGAADNILSVIGPLLREEQQKTKEQEDGTKAIAKIYVKGQKTKKFQQYLQLLGKANDLFLLSENKDFDMYERAAAAQASFEILINVYYELLKDVDAMGFNFANKQSGHSAGLSGN